MGDVKRMYEYVNAHFGGGSVYHLDLGVASFRRQITYLHGMAAGYALRAREVSQGQWDPLTTEQYVGFAEIQSKHASELEEIFGSVFPGIRTVFNG